MSADGRVVRIDRWTIRSYPPEIENGIIFVD